MLKKRAKKVFLLAGKGFDGIFITSPENVRYLTGFSGTEGSLLLLKDQGFFLTDGRYTVQAGDQVKDFKVITFREKWETLGRLISRFKVKSIGYESKNLTLDLFNSMKKEAGAANFEPLAEKLDKLRAVKETAEIRALKKAAAIAAESLEEVIPMITPGIKEVEIASELEYRMKKKGGESIAFQTIVASGWRSALPHGNATDKKIKRGEFVTIDYGVVYEGYASDETCTFVVGKPTAKQKKVYDAVKKAHDLAIKKITAGRALKEIDAAARNHIEKAGYGKYFTHSTGHGLGLCVHEYPVVSLRSKEKMKPGMVFTIEPGIYIPKWGGVRIEDTVFVKKQGVEFITKTDKTLRPVGN
jgi:Xaa-Pro aminopeptidase